jgi:drug/metabolite transporter (DMT)-like permease
MRRPNAAPRPARPSAYLALGIGVFVFGLGAILVRSASAPGSVTTFYRMAIAAVLVAVPFTRRVKRDPRPLAPRGVLFAIVGGASFAMDLWLWASGVMMSGATTPTLMANTAPLWVGLAGVLFFRERRGRIFWFGLALALLGAVVVLGADLARGAAFGSGTALGLVAAFFYAGYHVASQRGRAHLSTLTYFWIVTATATVVLLAVCLITRAPLAGYPAATYLTFLALGVVVQTVGWLSVNYVQGHLPASIVSPTLLGQPVVTALLAVPLLGERFTARHIVGGLAVLGGVYLVHRSRQRATPADPGARSLLSGRDAPKGTPWPG